MNDEEFQEYIDNCFDELERKQQYLIDAFGFGSFDKFKYDFDNPSNKMPVGEIDLAEVHAKLGD